MFAARHTAPSIRTPFAALIVALACAGLATAQVSNGDQWRAAGSPRVSPQRPAASNSNPNWQLPTQQPAEDSPQATDDSSNPLRKKSQSKPAATPAREPRAFMPPTNARQLVAGQSAAGNNANPATQQRGPSAIAPAAANGSMVQPAYVSPRPMLNSRPTANQQQPSQRISRTPQSHRSSNGARSDSVWDTINVAFQGQPPTKSEPESLPMPSETRAELRDPVMQNFGRPGEMNDPFGDEPYHPYGDSGPYFNGPHADGCADGVCEPGCGAGCGDACGEPTCACEPGCSCAYCRQKEVFCIGPGDDESCHTVQLRWPKWQEVTVFGGVQGFKNAYDQDRDSGNFGIHEGFNIGAKVPYCQVGYQFGYRTIQNQLNGDEATDTEGQNFQQFATAGFFHRQAEGLQFGTVWDFVSDERFHAFNYNQIRSELSCIGCGCHEIGFTATIGLNDHGFEDDNGDEIFFQASDQYLLFYRLHGENGGEGRFFAGANAQSDGLVGADMLLPIGDRFSIQGNFTYLIPDAESGEEGASEEGWNIGLAMVWHFHDRARKSHENCYRPVFNVADNGTLIIDKLSTDD